jgi:23S rRNA (cytosine1962-C5)-methyltransferase
MHQAVLKEKDERRLLRGHLWAYRNEFARLPEVGDGDVVDVVSSVGRFVGRGFYQASGGIAVRLLTRRDEAIDETFLARRVARARRYRDDLYPDEPVYRWVYGESDGLPGLVADRYGEVISAHAGSAFYARHSDALAEAFLSQGAKGVRVASGGEVRRFGGVTSPVSIELNGVRLLVDVESGQKTGMYLDQRENYGLMRRYARGATVLDVFCYAGAWSCHAAMAGATSVLGVDTSGSAIEQARTHVELNGVADRCRFECSDAETALKSGEKYQLIVLDPPALAKSRGQTAKALGMYQALNRDAMVALEPGGTLITCSCSHFVDAGAFLELLKRATRAAQRAAWLLELRGAARDHPVLLEMPETAYLKCAVLRVF